MLDKTSNNNCFVLFKETCEIIKIKYFKTR